MSLLADMIIKKIKFNIDKVPKSELQTKFVNRQ